MKLTKQKLLILFFMTFLLLLSSTSSPSAVDNISLDAHDVGIDSYVLPISFVTDHLLYYYYGNSTETIENSVNAILQGVNELFVTSDIKLAFKLDQLSIFMTKNVNFQYTVVDGEIDAEDLLVSFANWASTNSTYDNSEEVQLLTGADLIGGNIGLGYVGQPGQPSKEQGMTPYSLIQATLGEIGDIVTSTHEIAHNFGADHDSVNDEYSSCEVGSYIMGASYDPNNPPTEFSTCSVEQVRTILVDYFGSFIDNTNPIIDDILDQEIAKKSNGSITWSITDTNLGFYDVYVNGVLSQDDIAITGTSITVLIPTDVVTVLNITVVAYDLVHHTANDTVIVSIFGDRDPKMDDLLDFSVGTNTAFELNWTLYEDSDYLEIFLYLDNIQIDFVNMSQPITEYRYNISNLTPGIYNYTILIRDAADQIAVDEVIITVNEEITSNGTETETQTSTVSISEDTTVVEVITQTANVTSNPNQFESIIGSLSFQGNILAIFMIILVIPVIKRRNSLFSYQN